MKLLNFSLSLTVATTKLVASKSISIDYDLIDNNGNGVNNEITFPSHDYQDVTDYEATVNDNHRVNGVKRDPEKYQLAFANENQKRNILSALRAKIRRSDLTDVEEKYKFSPVLSVGEI